MIIKNDNGNEYKVLDNKGKYLLLENLNKNSLSNKFVIAYNYNNKSWQHGNYFDTLEDARNYFNTVKEWSCEGIKGIV